MKGSKDSPLASDALLLLAAAIWGFAFVAQSVAMEDVGTFAFNGIRFAMGALALSPLLFLMPKEEQPSARDAGKKDSNLLLWGGLAVGVILFFGASLQQLGLENGASAGNAGFITGLYVVLVPMMGLAIGQRTRAGTWVGAIIALVGLYLLSVKGNLTMAWGDALVLGGAFFWAMHVLLIGRISPKLGTIKLAIFQFLVCAGISLAVSAFTETTTLAGLKGAALPIVYGGLASVAIAYTIQVYAQKRAHPAHASVILSMEAVFAAIGGWLLLNEGFTPRAIAGCALMLAGIIVSQLWAARNGEETNDATA